MDAKHHNTYIKLGLNILYYRKERKLTQEQLADLAGYTQTHLQRVETARSAPSVTMLLDIANALEIPPHKLFEFK